MRKNVEEPEQTLIRPDGVIEPPDPAEALIVNVFEAIKAAEIV